MLRRNPAASPHDCVTALIFNRIQHGYRDGFLNQAKGQTWSSASRLIASVAEKMANHFSATLAYCRLSRFRFRYKVAGSIPKVFAAASRLDARPKMLRI